jgi:hypothetical protein
MRAATCAFGLFTVGYLAWVFRLVDPAFSTMGLGDWMDPYFTNALMEHWYWSLVRFANPISPPMYYPVDGTLGYSHGLVLYVPFYAPIRPFLHPFQAHSVMLLLVMAAGALALFVVLRKYLRLSSIEAGLLAAFFLTSRNVTNDETAVWLQRGSVFLIPMVLLIVMASARLRPGKRQLALAWVAGALSTLLFTQDFQTAVFAALLLFLLSLIVGLFTWSPLRSLTSIWRASPSRLAQIALIMAFLGGAWTVLVVISGGATLRLGNFTVRSHTLWRPAAVAVVGTGALLWFHRRRVAALLARLQPFHAALAGGAITGLAIFLWIYLPAVSEHGAFPHEDLLNLLRHRDPAAWRGPVDVLQALVGYRSMRTFAAVGVIALLVWLPPFRFDRHTRVVAAAVVLISLLVMVLPLRFGDFSVWGTFFWRVPGFSAIRDPSRVITGYELGAVVAIALFISRHRARRQLRGAIALLVSALLLLNWNPERFDYIRTNAEFDRWVTAPIAIDARCRAFFTLPGPAEYLARQGTPRAIYGIESLFVALTHSIPTLNGYSAWAPSGWSMGVPEESAYLGAARSWIDRHRLPDVCAFDPGSRSMRPF